MLHLFTGEIKNFWEKKYIFNDFIGIEIYYLWEQKKWTVFLFPYWDDNRKTISYYAFDSVSQKWIFEDMLKISWIWAKTAFQIVQLSEENIRNAIKDLDVKFFQNISWIWPKTAKKILLELKDSFTIEEAVKLDIDQKLYKNIIKSLKNLGYEASSVKKVLLKYDWKIDSNNTGVVIKWVIDKM